MHVCVCEVSEVYSMYAHTPQNAHRNWETHTHIRVCTSQLPVHTTRWAHDHKPLHANICKNSTYSRIRSMNMAFLYIHIYVYNTRQTFLNRDSHVCLCMWGEVHTHVCMWGESTHTNKHALVYMYPIQNLMYTQLGQSRWAHDHKPLHANICKNSTYSRIRSMNMAFLYIHIYVYNTRQTFLNRDSHVCLCMWGEVHTHVCMWGESTHTNKHALVYMYPIQNLMYTQLGQSRWAHDYNPLHTTICKNSLHDHFHRICAHVIQSKSQKPLQCMGHNLWQWACLCKGASTPRRKTSRRTSFVRSSAAAFF